MPLDLPPTIASGASSWHLDVSDMDKAVTYLNDNHMHMHMHMHMH